MKLLTICTLVIVAVLVVLGSTQPVDHSEINQSEIPSYQRFKRQAFVEDLSKRCPQGTFRYNIGTKDGTCISCDQHFNMTDGEPCPLTDSRSPKRAQ